MPYPGWSFDHKGRARRAVPDPMEASEEPVGQRCTLMRHQVERVMHQVAVEDRDGGGPGALDQMGEGGEMGLLTLVQRQGPGGLDQRPGLRPQARIVGHRVHPSLSQIWHGEFGCRLPCHVEQADGVAVDEVERPDRSIICGDRFGRRAGEVVSLGVLDHDWLPCWLTPVAPRDPKPFCVLQSARCCLRDRVPSPVDHHRACPLDHHNGVADPYLGRPSLATFAAGIEYGLEKAD